MTSTTKSETLMRAIATRTWGGTEVLEDVELPRPEPLPTEVLVRVRAASVNPVDIWSRTTGGFGLWGRPAILGHDVSGVVEAVGPGVALLAPGDEVFGMPQFPHQAGAYAQYVTAPPRHLARKPSALTHVEAAALPLAGLTAWQTLVETAEVQEGQRVLIHAAAGGVGHLAVQVAKARGAHVIGTARAAKHDWLRALGADELIDYETVDFAQVVRDVDVVIDGVGGEYAERSVPTLRDGGTLFSLPQPMPDEARAAAAERSIRTAWPVVEPDARGLSELVALVEAGRLRPRIDRVFGLDEVRAAHDHAAGGHVTGKVVIEVG
jgi:NADPH:quinone reductase-like Zn-dependent oxidoreductase